MIDIARYLIRQEKVDEVIAVVRRGPAEVKFDKKEMEYVIANLDQEALDTEIARVSQSWKRSTRTRKLLGLRLLEALPKAYPMYRIHVSVSNF